MHNMVNLDMDILKEDFVGVSRDGEWIKDKGKDNLDMDNKDNKDNSGEDMDNKDNLVFKLVPKDMEVKDSLEGKAIKVSEIKGTGIKDLGMATVIMGITILIESWSIENLN